MKLKYIILLTVVTIGLTSAWYFDTWHKPVEPINRLIGKNFVYAQKLYFESKPNSQYKINIKDNLNEFDGVILYKKNKLKNSIVHVYTWTYFNHKETIWVGETVKFKNEIIDAIRYKNNVNF